ELYWLVDVLVLLLRQLVIGHHFNRVLVLLGIRLLQQQRDIPDALAVLGLAQFDLDVVALAQPPQRLQLLRVGGDQTALHPEIAARALQVGNRLLQFRLGRRDLGLDAAHVRRDVRNLGVGRARSGL